MKLAWGNKVNDKFINRVRLLCDRLGWKFETHANWLMSCIAFETGETFSASVLNGAGSGAIGLIQFMPKTAHSLGTSTSLLAKMSAVEQLDYVEKYFKPYCKKISTLDDMYMAILFPKTVGMSPNTPLFISPSIAYRQNSGLDKNKDSIITKREAADCVFKKLEKGLLDKNSREV